MNKKTLLAILVLLVLVVTGAVLYYCFQSKAPASESINIDDGLVVKSVVEDFGKTLKNVSLLSPTAGDDIKKDYADFLTPELVDIWASHPMQALGRLTSSPWPDRIEVLSVEKTDSGTYLVVGKIVELTSEQEANGGMADSRDVGFFLTKPQDKWLISSAALSSNSNGVNFQYPVNLPAKYVSANDWPPTVKIVSGSYSCKQTPPTSSLSKVTTERIINGRTYCVDFDSEGAAGSVFMNYTYTTAIESGKLMKINFTLRYVNCANYEQPESQACSAEREGFNSDALVDGIAQTVEIE